VNLIKLDYISIVVYLNVFLNVLHSPRLNFITIQTVILGNN